MLVSYRNLSKYYEYCKETASVHNKKTLRKLVPDHELQVAVYDPERKKKTRIKYARLCWILGNAKDLPKSTKILHKNLDNSDFRLQNLKPVTSDVYNLVQEALRNLSGDLQLVIHPADQFAFMIKYVKAGRRVQEVIYDIVPAKRRLAVLQLICAKTLTKYCSTDV